MRVLKKIKQLVLLCLLLTLCASCGAKAHIGLGRDGSAVATRMSGSMPIEEWDKLKYSESRLKSLNEIEAQILEAIENNNHQRALELNELKRTLVKSFNYEEQETYANVQIVNGYTKIIVINSGEFKGEILEPKEETSYSKTIPTGLYEFTVTTTDSNGDYTTVTIKRIISKKTKKIHLGTVKK